MIKIDQLIKISAKWIRILVISHPEVSENVSFSQINVNVEGLYDPKLNKNVMLSRLQVLNTIFGHLHVNENINRNIKNYMSVNEKNIKHLTQILAPKISVRKHM